MTPLITIILLVFSIGFLMAIGLEKLWLVVSLVLTILAPKIFDLKDYKTDQILFTILIVNFILMLLIVYLAKTLKGSGKTKE